MMRSIPLLLCVACATTGPKPYGTIAIKSGADAAARPASYSVGQGTISSSDFRASIDNDCVRGFVGSTPLDFCRDARNPNHWTGASGDFTVAPSENGHLLRVDGYMNVAPGRDYSMTQGIELGQGPQWDELRKHPALLALAATAADLRAAHVRH
ncbi:MAG TPA: hypothetical protein VFA79_08990 [Myxococcales bacterium]|nr:hypothetical protein [Myxococcales bacterium]